MATITKGTHSNSTNATADLINNNGDTLVWIGMGLSNAGSASSFSGVKWNGTAMVQAVAKNQYRPGAEVWYLDNAEQGSLTSTCTTAWPSHFVTQISLIGADLSGSLVSVDSSTNTASSGVAISLDLTPTPFGISVMGVSGDWGADRGINWGAGQTELYDAYTAVHDHNVGTSFALSADRNGTMSFINGKGQTTCVAANFKAPSGAGSQAIMMWFKAFGNDLRRGALSIEELLERWRRGMLPPKPIRVGNITSILTTPKYRKVWTNY